MCECNSATNCTAAVPAGRFPFETRTILVIKVVKREKNLRGRQRRRDACHLKEVNSCWFKAKVFLEVCGFLHNLKWPFRNACQYYVASVVVCVQAFIYTLHIVALLLLIHIE